MQSLFTVLFEYASGTYISQITATSLAEVLPIWKKQLRTKDPAKWRVTREDLRSIVSRDLVALSGLHNVWCACMNG